MFSKVAITVLIFTLLLPWFTSAMGAFEHCPSCDKETCLLSAAQCRHGKKMEMGKIKEPAVAKSHKTGYADGCAIKLSCAKSRGYSLTLIHAEPHLITTYSQPLTSFKFLSYTFIKFTEFKDPYPLDIDRPPAIHPFYN